MIPSRSASIKHPRAPGRGNGPFTPPKPPLLINDDTYAVERVMSIIKEEDINDCDEYASTAIGESGLHDLAKVFPFNFFFSFFFYFFYFCFCFCKYSLLIPFLLICLSVIQAMVRMKTLKLRCRDYED